MKKERYSLVEILSSINIDFKIFKENKEEIKNFFKDGDVFAYILNNDLNKITLNLETETILAEKDGQSNLIIHNLSNNEFKNIIAMIIDRSLLDLASKDDQETTFFPRFGALVYKSEIKTRVTSKRTLITVESL